MEPAFLARTDVRQEQAGAPGVTCYSACRITQTDRQKRRLSFAFAVGDRMITIYFITVLLMLSSTVSAFDRDNCFPGKIQSLSSPSGTYEFIWKEPNDQNDEHHLLYRPKGKSVPHELLTFGRHLCIHWSPNEKYFSISDYIGSNVAEVYTFQSDDTSQRVEVMDLLPAEVGNYFKKGISHGYLETLSWNKDGLIVRAFGDREDKPRQFDVRLKCTMEQHQ